MTRPWDDPEHDVIGDLKYWMDWACEHPYGGSYSIVVQQWVTQVTWALVMYEEMLAIRLLAKYTWTWAPLGLAEWWPRVHGSELWRVRTGASENAHKEVDDDNGRQ